MCLPTLLQKQCNEHLPSENSIISIDPGVRVAATCYDPNQAKMIEWGKGDAARFYKLAKWMDKLQSQWQSKSTKCKRRYRLKKAWHRMITKIQNIVSEFHNKFTLWLCRNYQTIILPQFDSQAMVKKADRKIKNKAVRQMLAWSHGKLRQNLIVKARKFNNTIVLCSEEYTSKTCGKCSWVHARLGGNEKFQCNRCNFVSGRDHNGARNVLLKVMSELSSPTTNIAPQCAPLRTA